MIYAPRVRGLVLVALVGACTFTPGSGGGGGGGGGNAQPDAARGSSAAPDGSGGGSACPDVDHDSICDSQDDWLCGTKPAAPGDSITLGHPTWIPAPSNVSYVTFGDGPFVTTGPGVASTFNYAYGIIINCPGFSNCNAQVEFGIAGVGRAGCLFDGTVGDNLYQFNLNRNATITAPATSGLYELRAQVATSTSCGTGSAWSGGTEPDASRTFAYLCVP